jgi:transcriptional regulator with XRE-family HTH domain
MFPERLKDLRKEKGMTQIELATALGVSSGTVAMWETGKRKPSFEMFEKLTQVFDKRIDYILGTSDDPTQAKLNDMEVAQLGNWAMQEEYEDVMRKYSLLDDFGQKTIAAVLRMEFARCQEQETLKSGKSVSVSVKVRDFPDEVLTANTVEGE